MSIKIETCDFCDQPGHQAVEAGDDCVNAMSRAMVKRWHKIQRLINAVDKWDRHLWTMLRHAENFRDLMKQNKGKFPKEYVEKITADIEVAKKECVWKSAK